MDSNQLSAAFGGLSLSAREWKPQRLVHQQQQQQLQSNHHFQLQQRQHNHLHHHQQQQLQLQSPTRGSGGLQTQQQYSQLSPLRSNSSDWQSLESELNAASVKEFVPGKGWAVSTSAPPSYEVKPSPPPPNMLPPPPMPPPPVPPPINMAVPPNHAHGPWNPTYPGLPVPENPYPFPHGAGPPPPPAAAAGYHHLSSSETEEDSQYHETTIPSGPPPPPPAFRSLHTMGMPDDLWRMHREISLESTRQMEPMDPRHKAIPIPYCNAFCMDAQCRPGNRRRSSFGYHCDTFQVTSREDGFQYCLRRFDSVKSVSPKIAATVMERWSNMEPHPGLVQPLRCFLAQRAVFFVHQYIPGARSMRERISVMGPLPENVLWSAMTQMVSVLRRVHTANLAVRTIDMAHTLVKSDASQLRLRVFLNCAGVVDTLEFESRKNVKDLQVEDIRNLGRLILSMATGTELTAATEKETWAQCEHFCVQTYSRELHNLCFTLVRSPIPPNIVDVARAMANRAFDELDIAHQSLDRSEAALSAEYESGRALRLLMKMGFVNERPEFGPNRRWSQSGDNYVLSLFRDYVFHQADGAGNPVMDLGHVVTVLNKLDVADEEQIVLTSRDGKTLMIVSYADVARCLDSAYHELCSGSVPPSALRY